MLWRLTRNRRRTMSRLSSSRDSKRLEVVRCKSTFWTQGRMPVYDSWCERVDDSTHDELRFIGSDRALGRTL